MVVAAALVVGLVSYTGLSRSGSAHVPGGSAAPSAMPSPTGSACLPRVVDSGFTNLQGYLWYGLVVDNPCPYASVYTVLDVAARDASGRRLNAEHADTPPALPVILPGQRLDLAALIYLEYDGTKAVRLAAQVTSAEQVAASSFANWAAPVIGGLSLGRVDSGGFATLTFTVAGYPAGHALCHPVATVILRDRAGRIVLGMTQPVTAPLVHVDLPIPPKTDPARTQVTVAQGMPNLTLNNLNVLTCRAPA